MRLRSVIVAVALLALHPALAAAAGWGGGGAPPSRLMDALTAEPDGALVALGVKGTLRSAGAGQEFAELSPAQPGAGPLLAQLIAVAGGLRGVAGDGGLYASSDHGATWTEQGNLGELSSNQGPPDIAAWAIDRAQPDRVIRIHSDGAVERSDDGALSWRSAVPLSPDENGDVFFVSAVIDGGVIYATANGKVYRSADMADTWQPLTATPGALAGDPATPGILWTTGLAGTYRSADAGLTWHRRRAPVDRLVPSPTEPAVAWALVGSQVLVTVDAGVTWKSLADISGPLPPSVAPLPAGHATACFSYLDSLWCSRNAEPLKLDLARMGRATSYSMRSLAPDPLSPRHAIALSLSLAWETLDGGATWRPLDGAAGLFADAVVTRHGIVLAAEGDGIRFRARGSQQWRRQRGGPRTDRLVADPLTGTVYAVDGDHLWRSERGARFRAVPTRRFDIESATLISVGGRGRTILANVDFPSTSALHVSTDGGVTFRRLRVPGGETAVALVSPYDPRVIVATTLRGMFTTRNGGRSWQHAYAPRIFSAAPDPGRRGRWFAIWSGRVHVSTDDARTWRTFATLPAAPSMVGPFCCRLTATSRRLWLSAAPLPFGTSGVRNFSRPLTPARHR